ncbi:signal peptide peptidase SppA [Candidatus Acetothermia bacterium]|jgi:protease-4|nr:signal peptide peptidase SppA [Candidatus Acetothermia bacterium]MCI2432172.1 signal peptide peptidase SppA [Candidatus Acetothermia bacterium]MCI2436135.1 signal peptide peptidase SppA [Candidatus Acetothermia bacterium]
MRKRALFLILSALIGVWLLWSLWQAGVTAAQPKIALVRLSGAISESFSDGGLFSTPSGITPAQVERWLKQAERDPSVKALVFRIDSPGGTVAASQAIAESIKSFKAKTGKPIVVSMGDVAASGGYYISVYADKIIAQPGTLTGSIGVILTLFAIDQLLQNLGIKPEVFKSGRYKDIGYGLRPLNDEERVLLQKNLDELHEQFIQAVAEGRKLEIEKARELATGQPYSGTEALQLGLIDQLGGLEDALSVARSLANAPDATVTEYRPPTPGLLELLFGQTNAARAIIPSAELKPEVLYLLKLLEGWYAVPRY